MWKTIPNTNNGYEASTNRKIRSSDRFGADGRKLKGKILKPWVINSGYEMVCMMVEGKKVRKLVHILIAETFLGESNGLDVNHKDGNKLNNSLDNLEYVSRSENLKHAFANGLAKIEGDRRARLAEFSKKTKSKPIERYDIDGNFIDEFESVIEAYRQLGFERASITRCANGKQKTAYGYIFKWK